MEPEYHEHSHKKGGRLFIILFLVVIVLVALGALTLFQRRTHYQALAKETEALAIPTVAVFHPATESGEEDLVLPGTMQAYVESPIYARTSGYLKKWHGDSICRAHQDGWCQQTGSRQRHRRFRGQKGHRAIFGSQRAAARRTRIVQAYLRTVRRRDYAAQRGYRNVDQRRQWWRFATALFSGANGSPPRLCKRP